MFLDIGLRFQIRIQLYCQVYLFVYAIIGGLFLLWFFEVANLEFPLSLVIVMAYETLNFMVVLYSIFKLGATINEISNN